MSNAASALTLITSASVGPAQCANRRSTYPSAEDSDGEEGGWQDGGSASEGQGVEEGSEEAEQPSSSSDDGFIVSDDDEQGEVARQQL